MRSCAADSLPSSGGLNPGGLNPGGVTSKIEGGVNAVRRTARPARPVAAPAVGLRAAGSALLHVLLIGSPINIANRLIGRFWTLQGDVRSVRLIARRAGYGFKPKTLNLNSEAAAALQRAAETSMGAVQRSAVPAPPISGSAPRVRPKDERHRNTRTRVKLQDFGVSSRVAGICAASRTTCLL